MTDIGTLPPLPDITVTIPLIALLFLNRDKREGGSRLHGEFIGREKIDEYRYGNKKYLYPITIRRILIQILEILGR